MNKGIVAMLLVLGLTMTGCGDSSTNAPKNEPTKDEEFEVVAEKPVIYLYGYDNENVTVKLDYAGSLLTTYPKYNKEEGWRVVAKKDSTLIGADKNTYSYLYWEGRDDTEYDFSEGFCIKGSETVAFLEKQLKSLGMNRREINEFIVYWLPRMENNNYNVIAFQTKAYTDVAKLEVDPKPDKSFRIFMAWYPSAEFVEIKAQDFTVPSRGPGKILVEWGGAEVDPKTHKGLATASSSPESISDDDLITALASKTPEAIQALLIQATLKKQEIALTNPAAALGMPTPSTGAGTHPFTDKNGATTTFTEAEWTTLKNIWSYTCHAEDMIAQHTVAELRNLLK